MRSTRRRFIVGLSAATVTPGILSACGSSSAESDRETAAAFAPVEIGHRYGNTRIDRASQRIAVVGLVEQDALLALGVAPIATTEWIVGKADGRIFPWAEDTFEKTGAELPTVLNADDGIQLEKVAGLKPDLIIGIYSGMTEREYKRLSEIAPTVAPPKEYGEYSAPWEVTTRMVAQAIGRVDQGERVIAAVEDRFAAEATGNRELFDGAEVIVAGATDGLYLFAPEDPRARMLEQLGMRYPKRLLTDRKDNSYGWMVSTEKTTELGGLDGVIWFGLRDAKTGIRELWNSTDTAKEGRYVDIVPADGAYYDALNFVTPLSIPFVLDRYVPQLVALLDGDPATKPPVPAPA